jgi:exonuclease SbcC
MRLKKVRLRGFRGIWKGIKQEEVELGLEDIGGVVVLSGENGRGKTTLLENLQPFRMMPSRGITLKDAVFLKDSSKELIFEHGGCEYRSLVTVNANSGSSAGMLWRDGTALTTGKVSEYDEILIDMFGSPKLFFNSVFCPQNAESILSLTAGVRKAFFVEFLGLGMLQGYSEAAKAVSRAVYTIVCVRKQDLDKLKAEVTDPMTLREQIATLGAERDSLKREAEASKIKVADMKVFVKHLESEMAKQEEFRRQEKEMSEDRQHAHQSYVARYSALNTERANLERTIDSLIGQQEQLQGRFNLSGGFEDLQKREVLLQKRQGELSEAEKLIIEVEGYRRQLDVVEKDMALYERQIDLQPPQGAVKKVCDACEIQKAITGRAQYLAREKDRDSLTQKIGKLTGGFALFKTKMEIRTEQNTAGKELTAIRLQIKDHQDAAGNKAAFAKVKQQIVDAKDRLYSNGQELERAKDDDTIHKDRFADRIWKVKDRINPEIAESLNDSRNEMEATEEEVKRLDYKAVAKQTDVRIKMEEIKRAEEGLQKIAELEIMVQEKEATVFEWNFLKEICGRNKLQALELDAAAPAISDLSNMLLSKCFGGRFSMYFRTLDDEGREIFDVVVHDSFGDTVEEVPLAMTSGGEQVLLLHALRLAMTLYAKAKSGKDFRTIFVDEIDGPLHSSVRNDFASMNRKALTEGDFETMILVSHSSEVIESADRLIEFNDNGISLL